MRATATAVAATALAMIGLPAATISGQEAGQQQAPPPQVVLSNMHHVNEMEIRLGELAAERASRDDVRRYGERMVKDHRFGDSKVTTLAEELGFEMLPVPRLPMAPQMQQMQQKAEQLRKASGPDFDRMYLQMMVQSHETAVSTLGDALNNLPKGEVWTLVSRLRPILEQHLELARHISGGSSAPAQNRP